MKLVLGAIQLESPGDASGLTNRVFELLDEAVNRGAQLICLPELFNLPYFPCVENARDAWIGHAEEVTGPTVARMGHFARDSRVSLVIPFYERASQQVYNSAAFVGADGEVVGVYRKTQLPHGPHAWERSYFDVPDHGQDPVFELESAQVGVYICYERFFPEIPRALALAGAWILFNPAAAAGSSVRSWRSLAISHAVTNGLYVCAVNRVGTGLERERRFYGGSCIVDPTGEVIAKADGASEGVFVATVDSEVVAKTRRSWPFLEGKG